METIRLEVRSTVTDFEKGTHLRHMNHEANGKVERIEEIQVYKIQLEKNNPDILKEVFVDPIMEEGYFNEYQTTPCDWVVETGFLPGVTDNSGHSGADALELVNLKSSVYTGKIFKIAGNISKEEVETYAKKHMANTLIQSLNVYSADEFEKCDRFNKVELPLVKMSHDKSTETFNLELSDEELNSLSVNRCLALNLSEFKHMKKHYQNADILEERKKKGLPKWPTDVELEVIAQSWSEHCKHKIFSGTIEYTEGESDIQKKLGNKKIEGLYKNYIKKATRDVEKERGITWLKSVFSDNAGVVRFDDKLDLTIKAETHNSPSALDPYGGALTGILGVNRDILGVGMGSKPIANTDVFCFACPDWPLKGMESKMPSGLMAPKQLLEGVHKGVEDGGNKSGIPTVNGAIYFDQDYAGKPLVFVGTIGVMPHLVNDGAGGQRDCHQKYAQVGDQIFMVGGAIGADGIHGATFSSLELNESSPATAVQIGDPLTQKRVMDFLLVARDRGLFSSITDNGAGGLSSSVGEMATATNGARLDLSLCPVKYPGLSPWELMISESQERMTFAVPQKDCVAFLELANDYGVAATNIGEFNDSGFLDVYYGDQLTGSLELHFLHDSLPPMELKAHWDGPRQRRSWIEAPARPNLPSDLGEVVVTLLGSDNIRSKEYWVRQYDHEVQGATAVKPFGGEKQNSPNDAGVVWLGPHGGEENNAVSIGCGIAPRISLHDPYYMAQFAVDEAVRNIVSQGGDIDHLCLLDNFCWPDPVKTEKNPDGDYKLGQLVRTCEGLYDICCHYGTPLVSGKDSMKNDFRGKDYDGKPLTISILPTLLVTGMAKTNLNKVNNGQFKNDGDLIYLMGGEGKGLIGSELLENYQLEDKKSSLPAIDLKQNLQLYRQLFKFSDSLSYQSLHDISDGGLICSLVECCFGNGVGAQINLSSDDLIETLFNEAPGRFVLSINPDKKEEFEKEFANLAQLIGSVSQNAEIELSHKGSQIFKRNLEEFENSFLREWE